MENYRSTIENINNIIQKLSYVKLHLILLPGESFYKDKFQIKPYTINKLFTFYITRNPYNYNYFIESLFYEKEQECLFKNFFNFYQELIEIKDKIPYSCSTLLVSVKILKQMEKHKLIYIDLITEEAILFKKIRSFNNEDLFFLMPLLEELKIDICKFNFYTKENKLYITLKKSILVEEIKTKKVKGRLVNKRKELLNLKEYYKSYILNDKKINSPTYMGRSYKK